VILANFSQSRVYVYVWRLLACIGSAYVEWLATRRRGTTAVRVDLRLVECVCVMKEDAGKAVEELVSTAERI
jgi:hypothetical protein